MSCGRAFTSVAVILEVLTIGVGVVCGVVVVQTRSFLAENTATTRGSRTAGTDYCVNPSGSPPFRGLLAHVVPVQPGRVVAGPVRRHTTSLDEKRYS